MKGEVTISLEEYERLQEALYHNKKLNDCLTKKHGSVMLGDCFGYTVVIKENEEVTEELVRRNKGLEDHRDSLLSLLDLCQTKEEQIKTHVDSNKNIFGNVDGDSIIELLK